MLLRSLAAQIYDSFIITALFFAFTTICLLFNHGTAIAAATRWYQFCLIALFVAYYMISLRYGGQTIGMRAWRLQLISKNGNLNWQQTVRRLLLILPAYVVGLVSFHSPQQLLSQWTKTRLQVVFS
ncbi:RDD family protein [Legionella hackeliae]|uniref:Predicted membrane protein n=1 Tax=Legionella hackeliae TaxID=449 RepID=A0A0A8UT70_LEGHA|nr:RDD family protein [Legionella hackeliae]KTD12524.1 RDD family protein [Legionella hackeliae]CEK11938.1 Predicted membrane protein [Legionella hackeliae]STX48712.1 RDD family [Legionella hackeliae]